MNEVGKIRLKALFLRIELTVDPRAKKRRDYKSQNLRSKRGDIRNNK